MVHNLKENKVPQSKSEYDYQVVDDLADGDPPICPSLMMHLYDKPEDSGDDTLCLDAFPKRKAEKLYWRKGQPNVGWGIYLKEEPSEMFFILNKGLIGLSIGLIFGVAWNTTFHDDQRGFPWTVVAWISAFVVFALDALKEWVKVQYNLGV
jgi:hypothetical protein